MILYSSFFIQDLLLEIKKQRTKYFLSNLMYHQSTLNVWGSGTLKAFVARQDILKRTFHSHPVSVWLLIEWISKHIFKSRRDICMSVTEFITTFEFVFINMQGSQSYMVKW